MKILTILSTLFLISCNGFQRNSDSGYGSKSPAAKRSSRSSRSLDRSNEVSTPQRQSELTRLQNLENSLNTKKEVEQYSKVLPYFRSESERVEFLSQGNFEEKQKWLNENNFLTRPSAITREMHELVEVQDITLGMPQPLVKKSWGEPDVVEVSGNPSFRNERWRYSRYVSTSDGYKPEKKIVYFEGGRVVGWEVE